MVGMNNKVIVIIGPTASGKTSLAVELAGISNLEIISADSRQLFKYMDIGTAKPTKDELSVAKHHFIDVLEPDEHYSAGKYGEDARIVVNEIIQRNKIPVIVGGSGLYIDALCEGLFNEDEDLEKRKNIRKSLEYELSKSGKDELFDKLKALDPESANNYSDKNPRRVIRALEYILVTGKKISLAQKNNLEKKLICCYFGINFERNLLYDRINKRVDLMIENGLTEETRKLLDMGFSKDLNSLNTVGYKEIIKYLDGHYSLSDAIDEIKKNTRRYAKRQITWFKRYKDAIWFEPNNIDIDLILKSYNEK